MHWTQNIKIPTRYIKEGFQILIIYVLSIMLIFCTTGLPEKDNIKFDVVFKYDTM